MAILSAAEIGAIFIVARHEISMFSAPASRQNGAIKSSDEHNVSDAQIGPASMPVREIILIDGTPVWTTISGP
jgi:hypothetical protein